MLDKVFTNNQVTIAGEVVSEFVFSHEVYGEHFFIVDIAVCRSQIYHTDGSLLKVHLQSLSPTASYGTPDSCRHTHPEIFEAECLWVKMAANEEVFNGSENCAGVLWAR